MYGRKFGLDRDAAMRIGSGFGTGMRMGEICGAVTGAYMVIGLAHASAECHVLKGREPVYAALADFRRRFTARNRTLICRELLGSDPSTAEGARIVKERGLAGTLCLRMVRDAAEILDRMLGTGPA